MADLKRSGRFSGYVVLEPEVATYEHRRAVILTLRVGLDLRQVFCTAHLFLRGLDAAPGDYITAWGQLWDSKLLAFGLTNHGYIGGYAPSGPPLEELAFLEFFADLLVGAGCVPP
jgi:hypothetical protein